tara:strand:- start:648 stop:1004 length:357 start_codon:yes stop_codon:yes gene_type:complete
MNKDQYNEVDTMCLALNSLYEGKWAYQDGTVDGIGWIDEHTTTDEEKEKLKLKFTEFASVTDFNNLRFERNKLLAETDWMANFDVVMSDAWKLYRQQLRDLPANTSDPKNPSWPTKPS